MCGPTRHVIDRKRVNVSAAFFLSIEFQGTGYFVIRAQKSAFGSAKSNPRYAVFLSDQRQIGDGVVIGSRAPINCWSKTNKSIWMSLCREPTS